MERALKKYFVIFALPTLIAFAISFLIPFFLGIYLSFTEFTTVTNSTWVGFENYKKAFVGNPDFLNALWFTLKFTVVSVISINLIAFIFALLLTRGLKGTNIFRTVFFNFFFSTIFEKKDINENNDSNKKCNFKKH